MYTYVMQQEIEDTNLLIKVSRFTHLEKDVQNFNKQESVFIAYVVAGPEGWDGGAGALSETIETLWTQSVKNW